MRYYNSWLLWTTIRVPYFNRIRNGMGTFARKVSEETSQHCNTSCDKPTNIVSILSGDKEARVWASGYTVRDEIGIRTLSFEEEVDVTEKEVPQLPFVKPSHVQSVCQLNYIWVFLYGPVVWSEDIPYVKTVTGYIQGYSRKLQRPVHATSRAECAMGLIVEDERSKARVWGVAFQILDKNEGKTMRHLQLGKEGRFKRIKVPFCPANSSQKPFKVIVYVDSSSVHELTEVEWSDPLRIGKTGLSGRLVAVLKQIPLQINEQRKLEVPERGIKGLRVTYSSSDSALNSKRDQGRRRFYKGRGRQ